jgi:hypothetical protein
VLEACKLAQDLFIHLVQPASQLLIPHKGARQDPWCYGAAFATWGIIKPELFRWTSGEGFIETYESSPGRDRCFCKKCGAPLVSTHSGVVGEVVAGTVDGDPGARPREHIFVASRASWHEITDALPQYDEWPP